MAINSRFNSYTSIKKAPILPKIKRIKSPINGVKITGRSIGRLATCRVVAKGRNVRPRSVFAQIYVTKIKKVLFFIVYRKFSI